MKDVLPPRRRRRLAAKSGETNGHLPLRMRTDERAKNCAIKTTEEFDVRPEVSLQDVEC